MYEQFEMQSNTGRPTLRDALICTQKSENAPNLSKTESDSRNHEGQELLYMYMYFVKMFIMTLRFVLESRLHVEFGFRKHFTHMLQKQSNFIKGKPSGLEKWSTNVSLKS